MAAATIISGTAGRRLLRSYHKLRHVGVVNLVEQNTTASALPPLRCNVHQQTVAWNRPYSRRCYFPGSRRLYRSIRGVYNFASHDQPSSRRVSTCGGMALLDLRCNLCRSRAEQNKSFCSGARSLSAHVTRLYLATTLGLRFTAPSCARRQSNTSRPI